MFSCAWVGMLGCAWCVCSAGKTTLLNLLSGRAKFGEYSGQLKLNACTYPVNKYRALMKQQGYVLQTDYFLEDLTVRQTMDFAAAMKLPCKSPEARHRHVLLQGPK